MLETVHGAVTRLYKSQTAALNAIIFIIIVIVVIVIIIIIINGHGERNVLQSVQEMYRVRKKLRQLTCNRFTGMQVLSHGVCFVGWLLNIPATC